MSEAEAFTRYAVEGLLRYWVSVGKIIILGVDKINQSTNTHNFRRDLAGLPDTTTQPNQEK